MIHKGLVCSELAGRYDKMKQVFYLDVSDIVFALQAVGPRINPTWSALLNTLQVKCVTWVTAQKSKQDLPWFWNLRAKSLQVGDNNPAILHHHQNTFKMENFTFPR